VVVGRSEVVKKCEGNEKGDLTSLFPAGKEPKALGASRAQRRREHVDSWAWGRSEGTEKGWLSLQPGGKRRCHGSRMFDVGV
jgi:hypothetical protein